MCYKSIDCNVHVYVSTIKSRCMSGQENPSRSLGVIISIDSMVNKDLNKQKRRKGITLISLWSNFRCRIDLFMDYIENLKHQKLNVKVQALVTNKLEHLRVLLYVKKLSINYYSKILSLHYI